MGMPSSTFDRRILASINRKKKSGGRRSAKAPKVEAVVDLEKPTINESNGSVSAWVPIRIYSEANERSHWRISHARAHAQKALVELVLRPIRRFIPAMPVTVVLCRYGPKRLDTDNLGRGLKATQDQVASIIGVDDGDSRYCWKYEQQKSKDYKVWIHIRPRMPSDVPVVESPCVGKK